MSHALNSPAPAFADATAATRWLSLACIIPGIVIAAVHGTRYRALGAQREALARIAADLDR